MVEECGGLIEMFEGYYINFKKMYLLCEVEVNFEYVVCQIYIVMGFVMVVVVELGVDCMLMEGFDFVKVDEILGFLVKGLCLVMFLFLGVWVEMGDWFKDMLKVWKVKFEMVLEIV